MNHPKRFNGQRPPVGARRAVPLVNHSKRFNGQRPPVGARRAVPAFDHAVACPNLALQNQGTGPRNQSTLSQNQGTVLRSQGTARRAPTVEKFGRPVAGSLATIVRSFKSAATKRINALRDNPAQWELDTNHPTREKS